MDHSQHSIHGHGHSAMPDITHQHMHDVVSSTESTPPAMDHHDHNVHTAMEHGMSMAFHFGYDEVILFSPWKISTVAGLIGSMFAIFVMATLYEGLKYYREYLFWKTYNLLEYRPVSMPEKGAPPDEARPAPTVHYVGEVIHKQPGAESNDSELSQPQIKKVTKPSMLSWMHLYQTFLHIIQVTLSFLLMLIFMTYNVWLCLAVVLGAAVGYFLFCWKKSVIVDVTEHCH